METFDAICKRASIRQYQDKEIPKEMLEKLVDAGRRAPTARAVEPWEFIVVVEKETLKKLGKLIETGVFLKDAAACVVIFCKETKYFLEDGSAATENVLLAAADAGLGACWIAGDKKPYAGDVAQLLNVPSSFKLISLIALGWPLKPILQRKLRALKEVIHWEKF